VYNQGNLSNTIVNMSLELQPPTECLPSLVNHVLAFKGESVTFTSPMNWSSCGGYTPPETVTSIASNATDARLFVPMGLVMEQMAAAGVTLVAAAGNDSTSYTLGADMPGAYCNAISVGALSGTPASGMGTVSYNSGGSTRAPYANLPTLEANGCLSVSLNNASGIPDVVSTPLTDGTATAYAYATGEVCSLFMDQSNSNYVNTSIDSSLWSGSSFSAPVISAEEALGILTQTSYQQPCS
jgi:hypothetical protein